jgi:hypothetical protein
VGAQSLQTWVSGFGSDSNPCTINAPCQTISHALAATAPGGEVSILDAGPYIETSAINIAHSVTINGVGALGTISAPAGSAAITVNAGLSDVVILRGLSFNGGSVNKTGGATNAVSFTTGGRLHVENSSMSGFTSDAIYFAPTGNSMLFVNNVSFRNSWGSVYAVPGANGSAIVSLNNIRSENNSRGVRCDDGSKMEIRNSVVSGNEVGNGYAAVGSGARPILLTIENSTATFNAGAGIYASGAGTILRLHNVVVTDNAQNGINAFAGVTVMSSGTNRIDGNTGGNLSSTTVLTSWAGN